MAKPGSRAVLRPVDAGLDLQEACQGCDDMVIFLARIPSKLRKRVVANVYRRGIWDRVEVWHLICYVRHGMPYGVPIGMTAEETNDIAALCAAMPYASQRDVLNALVALYRSRNVVMFSGP